MSSMSNVSYTNQSMNGIITLSDGMGTTIENGTITTNTLFLLIEWFIIIINRVRVCHLYRIKRLNLFT